MEILVFFICTSTFSFIQYIETNSSNGNVQTYFDREFFEKYDTITFEVLRAQISSIKLLVSDNRTIYTHYSRIATLSTGVSQGTFDLSPYKSMYLNYVGLITEAPKSYWPAVQFTLS